MGDIFRRHRVKKMPSASGFPAFLHFMGNNILRSESKKEVGRTVFLLNISDHPVVTEKVYP
jgi:hypothetical protein